MKALLPILLSVTNPDLPDPSTLTKQYLEQMSQRQRGQTEFVVKNRIWGQQQQQQQQQQQEQQQDGSSRDIQESDVYKIGNPSKKELFLLNNYRGFQVISFEDGLAKPKLISRLPVYNNWGSEMYYLEGQEKVLILNTEWSYVSNDWASNYSTKVYLIDVQNSREPKIVNEISLTGYLQETRMVGDVLYTITHNGGSDKKVKVTSIKLGYGDMETIDEEELHSENKYVQTMNVVKDNNKFYVISTLSNWDNQGDLINVHDISSPNGKIHKVMTVKGRGRITERSGTFMHKGHLFAVSNYTENNSPLRVSVEAFPLEKNSNIAISKPHMRVSVGDTNGLNASLQDVRVSGDHLYAFWVPANNVDPFELFDISNPQGGIKHLGQLQFDGWISKAFPINHEGRKYVLGLGWVAPVTNENGRRLPQAKLFEIKEQNGVVKHEVVSSLTIESEEIWASFNNEDKYFEMINEGNGKLNILFPVTFWKSWKSGAKVVTLDLNTHALGEGASVQGEQGWLKRVFTNKGLEALHAFSNERLENFDHTKLSLPGMARTVSVLELARNILSFHEINDVEGVQIVENGKSIEVRKVSLSKADAEKTEILDVVKIQGNHVWHKVKGKILYSITADYSSDYKLQQARFQTLNLETNELTNSVIPLKREETYYLNVRNVSTSKEELFIVGEEMFRLTGTELRKHTVAADCRYFFGNESGNLTLKSFGDDIIAFNSFKLKDAQDDKNAYYMPFFKVLDFDAEAVTCSRSINVPGVPVLAQGDYVVASEDMDDWYDYEQYGEVMMKRNVGNWMPRYRSASKTTALKLQEKNAMITDTIKRNISGGVFKDGFATLERDSNLLSLWNLDSEGEFMMRPLYLDYDHQETELIGVKTFYGRSFAFIQNRKSIDVFEITGGKKIREVKVENRNKLASYSIEDISAAKDLSRFYLSMGMYGINELKVK
jgi:Beta propeller domain